MRAAVIRIAAAIIVICRSRSRFIIRRRFSWVGVRSRACISSTRRAADALEGRRRTLGPSHPHTLGSMNNLAALLKAQGHLEEARPLYVDALEGRRRTLGPSHPHTFTSMLNLATLLADVNEREAAAALLRECFAGRQRVLGRDHPHTIDCKKWMDHLGVAK